MSTLNVQHLKSLNDTIYDITGIRVKEVVPDHVVRDADEVVMVDITPRALLHRLERGDIYAPDKVGQALQNWFREGNLSPTQSSLRLLRRGWRTAERLKGAVTAVYVESRPPTPQEQEVLRNDLALADRLKIPVVTLSGDIAPALIAYARKENITQIVLGHSDRTWWQEFVRGSIVNRLVRELRSVDILIVASVI